MIEAADEEPADTAGPAGIRATPLQRASRSQGPGHQTGQGRPQQQGGRVEHSETGINARADPDELISMAVKLTYEANAAGDDWEARVVLTELD